MNKKIIRCTEDNLSRYLTKSDVRLFWFGLDFWWENKASFVFLAVSSITMSSKAVGSSPAGERRVLRARRGRQEAVEHEIAPAEPSPSVSGVVAAEASPQGQEEDEDHVEEEDDVEEEEDEDDVEEEDHIEVEEYHEEDPESQEYYQRMLARYLAVSNSYLSLIISIRDYLILFSYTFVCL